MNFIETIEFIFKESNKKDKKEEKTQSEKLFKLKTKEEIEKLPLWQKIRRKFMDYHFSRDEAIGMDNAWFSKLKLQEIKNKGIKLLAPSLLVKDYVNSNYIYKIEKITKELGYNFVEIEYEKNM